MSGRCKTVYLDQLQEITDVTPRVQGAIGKARRPRQPPGSGPPPSAKSRRNAWRANTDAFCQVVTLYRGGQYKLYRFRRFTDVRLVMAPESQMAFFGGDPDNFTYPALRSSTCRSCAPTSTASPPPPSHHFAWSKAGAKEDDLIFVIGNPGSTGRLNTMSQLKYLRDVSYPGAAERRSTGASASPSSSPPSPTSAPRPSATSSSACRTRGRPSADTRLGLLDPEADGAEDGLGSGLPEARRSEPGVPAQVRQGMGRDRPGAAGTARHRGQAALLHVQRRPEPAPAHRRHVRALQRRDGEARLAAAAAYRDGNRKQLEIAMVAGAPIDTVAERLWLTAWFTRDGEGTARAPIRCVAPHSAVARRPLRPSHARQHDPHHARTARRRCSRAAQPASRRRRTRSSCSRASSTRSIAA